MTIADLVVSVHPCAEGSGQGIVGSLLLLLYICQAGWYFLLGMAWAFRTRLVERGHGLAILGLLCPERPVGSAVGTEVLRGVNIV